MAEIKTIYKGESISLLFTFSETYDTNRIINHHVFFGETEFTGVVDGQTIILQLKSSDTNKMVGNHKITLWIEDSELGLRKPYCGDLVVAKTQASGGNGLKSEISDIIIPVVISETSITIDDVMYNYMVGKSAYEVWLETHTGTIEDYEAWIKGDPFLYEDFTPEQLEALKVKGDPFLYEDFTPEQIAELQRPATDAVTAVNEAEALRVAAENTRVQNEEARVTAEGTRQSNETARVNAEDDRDEAEALRLSAEITRGQNEQARVTAEGTRQSNETERENAEDDRDEAEFIRLNAETTRGQNEQSRINAEGLRVTAEQTRQTNTATAITNANTAATNANNVANTYATTLAGKQDKELVVDYTHISNKQVVVESIDFATSVITATAHGLANGNSISVVSDELYLLFPFDYLPNGLSINIGYFVINATVNTFQMTATYNGTTAITLTDKATKDYSKWKFERLGSATFTNLSLKKFIIEFSGRTFLSSNPTDYFYLTGSKNYGSAGDVWFVSNERTVASNISLGKSLFNIMVNGDIWNYKRLEIDVTQKRATVLINGYRIYTATSTTRGFVRNTNEFSVHQTAGEDTITSITQQNFFNGVNIKIYKLL